MLFSQIGISSTSVKKQSSVPTLEQKIKKLVELGSKPYRKRVIVRLASFFFLLCIEILSSSPLRRRSLARLLTYVRCAIDQADDECRMCRGVNLGKLLSCLGCDRCTHLDCLEAVARVQYMLRQVHYDQDVWLCTKCQVILCDDFNVSQFGFRLLGLILGALLYFR